MAITKTHPILTRSASLTTKNTTPTGKAITLSGAQVIVYARRIRLIADIESRVKAGQSEQGAKISYLKQAARTVNFLTENKIEYYADLESKVADVTAAYERHGRYFIFKPAKSAF